MFVMMTNPSGPIQLAIMANANLPQNNPPGMGGKPVPMKLFSSGEVDRTPANCIPRFVAIKLNTNIEYLNDELNTIYH